MTERAKPIASALFSVTIPPASPLVNVQDAQLVGGVFSFSVLGPAGTGWDVYASTDLSTWAFIGSITLNGSNPVNFSETVAGSVPHRFYRVSSDNGYYSRSIGFMRVTAHLWNGASDLTLIANQLEAPDNTLLGLFANAQLPNGTQITKQPAGTPYTWDAAAQHWSNGGDTVTFAPGEAAYLRNVTPSEFQVAFVGLVPDGTLTLNLAVGANWVGFKLPQGGGITSVLGYKPTPGDLVFIHRGGFTGFQFDPDDLVWSPSEPVIEVGEAVQISPAADTVWNTTFAALPLPAFDQDVIVLAEDSDGPCIQPVAHLGHPLNSHFEAQAYVEGFGPPVHTEAVLLGDCSGVTGVPGWASGVTYHYSVRWCEWQGIGLPGKKPLSLWSRWYTKVSSF